MSCFRGDCLVQSAKVDELFKKKRKEKSRVIWGRIMGKLHFTALRARFVIVSPIIRHLECLDTWTRDVAPKILTQGWFILVALNLLLSASNAFGYAIFKAILE